MKKLQFAELENQFPVIEIDEMKDYYGGYWSTSPDGEGDMVWIFDGGTDCVFQTMSYLSNKPGNSSSFSPDYYIQRYELEHGAGSASDGLDPYSTLNFLDEMFFTSPANLSSLNGNVTSSNIFCSYSTGPGNEHAVSLTFVNAAEGVCIGVDQQNGTVVTFSSSDINTSTLTQVGPSKY